MAPVVPKWHASNPGETYGSLRLRVKPDTVSTIAELHPLLRRDGAAILDGAECGEQATRALAQEIFAEHIAYQRLLSLRRRVRPRSHPGNQSYCDPSPHRWFRLW